MSALIQRLAGWRGVFPGRAETVIPVRGSGYARAAPSASVPGFDQPLVWVTVGLLALGLVG